jgi:hypothetical protein
MDKNLNFHKAMIFFGLILLVAMITVPMAIELGLRFNISWLITLSNILVIPIFIATSPAILTQARIKKMHHSLSHNTIFLKIVDDGNILLVGLIIIMGQVISSGIVIYFLHSNPGKHDFDFFVMPLGGLYLWHQIAQLTSFIIGIIWFSIKSFYYCLKHVARDKSRNLLIRIGFVLLCISVIIKILL